MGDRPYFITWQDQEKAHTVSIEKAVGNFLITNEGKRLFDFSSTSYHAIFGNSHPEVVKAMMNQAKLISVSNPKSIFKLKEEVSYMLLKALKKRDGKLFYTVSGAESVENALKMARQRSGKKIILAREQSYHGATLGALSITGDWRNKKHDTIDEWTARIPEPHDDPKLIKTKKIIKSIGPHKIAAFCLETITGGNGVIIPPKSWFEGIQKICDQYKIQLILDEVVCGFHRTGKPFGFHHYKLRPDYICMAKGINAGHCPFGAVWVSKSASEDLEKEVFSYGLTNYAHPLGLASTKKVLQILEREKLQTHLKQLQKSFKKHLDTLKKNPFVKEVRQIGLLAAIETNGREDLFDDFKESGLFVSQVRENIILCPSYITSLKQVEKYISKIDQVILKKYSLDKEKQNDKNISVKRRSS
ncbi:aspartate aminotransferase family protein [Halobacteriovorax sp. GB3]|uniref:aspartate aminotransferase family protein n=1 Tax=Halobacteriovorax sp. GB3 TaxID=2719615 RepID=UPI00235FF977|nr:aspartate aminotransferase family protein [Halobacteriovorax sp. GB3]MDD0852697.1 aspartate aminotransferase family protein [Halobacteriovorax sp. GB3]